MTTGTKPMKWRSKCEPSGDGVLLLTREVYAQVEAQARTRGLLPETLVNL